MSKVLQEVIEVINSYLIRKYKSKEMSRILKELSILVGKEIDIGNTEGSSITYEQAQQILSKVNEKELNRRKNGVYYTPKDVVNFILVTSLSISAEDFDYKNIQHLKLKNEKSYIEKKIFDPTCGTGEFLLESLKIKLDTFENINGSSNKDTVHGIVRTIFGNDINVESIIVTKLRIFITILHRYGIGFIEGLGDILNNNFSFYDYVTNTDSKNEKYDIIIGNPPYVEDSRSGLILEKKYGNVYANVLENSANQLKENGVMGFIVPLSYVSTVRMKKIRNVLYNIVPEQYILNYSDRPDSLFTSVHQKLSILFARKKDTERKIYTGNYTYWYREERDNLFNNSEIILNKYVENEFIPKIGTQIAANIYEKVSANDISLYSLLSNRDEKGASIYLNMRAAFWIKAFLSNHTGTEYKEYKMKSKKLASYVMCVFNSSLFWWYWNCVSDCWHITQKELKYFKVPKRVEYDRLVALAENLELKLEETKKYVGTKQTQYEYKHKLCIKEIHAIDDYINSLFGLSEIENEYIKNFAINYRISGGKK